MIAEKIRAQTWISMVMINFISLIISVLILKTELNNRNSAESKLNSKMMWYIPIIAFICTIISNIFGVVLYIDGFCYISYHLMLSSSLYYFLMGLYQISRLHYCFAQSQVHSNKGYPNWLINIMYIIGIVSIINSLKYLV